MGVLDDFLGWAARQYGPGGQPQSQQQTPSVPPDQSPIIQPTLMGGSATQYKYAAEAERMKQEAQNTPGAPAWQAPPTPTVDPKTLAAAVNTAKTRYPRLASYPIALTTGKGPYESETFKPEDKDNPMPGQWNIQLRSAKSMANPSLLPDTVASEMQHALYEKDARYKAETDAFVKSMTPDQLASAKRAYQNEKIRFGDTGDDTFQQWLPKVQAQEYIRGHLFPNVNPGWTGPQGEGGYTPQQQKQLTALKTYLMTKDAKPTN